MSGGGGRRARQLLWVGAGGGAGGGASVVTVLTLRAARLKTLATLHLPDTHVRHHTHKYIIIPDNWNFKFV